MTTPRIGGSLKSSSPFATISVLTLCGFMFGCSATMVSTHGNDKSVYAPVNEAANRGGVVKYLNQGSDSVTQSRRRDAYKKMHEFCNGDYSITSEAQRADGGTSMPVGNMTMYDTDQYTYITFKCVDR